MMTLLDQLPAKLRARIGVDWTGCWLWSASVKPNGYGAVTYKGRTRNAHRLIYEILVRPVPLGLELDHLCRVRHCVNPAHLEPVTRRENQRRGLSFAGERMRQTQCYRGHTFTVENTYISKRGHRSCRACGAARARRVRRERAVA